MSPYIQYGFAGFAFCMLAVIVWLIWQLLKVLKENNKVINANTTVIASVQGTAKETRELMIEIKDQLLSRPCLFKQSDVERVLRRREERETKQP